MILTEVVLQPTKKPRSIDPHKFILKKNGNERKSRLGNKKYRSVSKPLYGIHANPNSINGLKSPRHLLYKSSNKNKYPLRNTSTLITIVGWKSTKKQSHIISNISIPGFFPHCGFNHKFKLSTGSPSMSNKYKRLLYGLMERLIFICVIIVYLYIWGMEFYSRLYLYLYKVTLYAHLQWHLYGEYFYTVYTKISLLSHLYK